METGTRQDVRALLFDPVKFASLTVTVYRSKSADSRAIARAQAAGVEIPHWHPHQIRHQSIAETRNRFGDRAARDFAGHGSVKVTNGYGKNKIKGIGKKQLERIVRVATEQPRIFSQNTSTDNG